MLVKACSQKGVLKYPHVGSDHTKHACTLPIGRRGGSRAHTASYVAVTLYICCPVCSLFNHIFLTIGLLRRLSSFMCACIAKNMWLQPGIIQFSVEHAEFGHL